MPKRFEASLGNKIVISDGTCVDHTVEITGSADWFGRMNVVHDLAIPYAGYGVIPVDGKFLKPGSYTVECDVHKRM